jgi:hypothetical protein
MSDEMKVKPVCRGVNSLISPQNVEENKGQQIAEQGSSSRTNGRISLGIPSVLRYSSSTNLFKILCVTMSCLET